MNNIENLAIEHCVWTNSSDGYMEYIFDNSTLESFAKAYAQQQTEPVGFLTKSDEFYHLPNSKLLNITHEELIQSIDEEGILLFTHPSATVPLDDAKVQDLILELKCLGEVLAMEMTTIEGNPIAPIVDDAWKTIERLVATQSASVPLEKYNKVLDDLKEVRIDVSDLHADENKEKLMNRLISVRFGIDQAIAEAEGKEG